MFSACRIYKLRPCTIFQNISSHVHRQTDEAGRNVFLCITIVITVGIIMTITTTIMFLSVLTRAPRNHFHQAEMEKRNEASSQERDPKAECKLPRQSWIK